MSEYIDQEVIDMESEKQNESQKAVPVYLSFKTLQSAIQSLRTHGLPGVFDRTAFDSRSGGEQTQILSAFKFLGFIDDANRTQPILRQLKEAVEGSEEEKAILASVLKERYANAIALNLESATPAQLDKAIADYGAGGSTKERSVRFFVKAAEYAGIELSPRLTARKPRSPNVANDSDTGQKGKKGGVETLVTPPSGHAMITVELPEAGGTLTISGTFNPFGLVGEERTLVNGISDLVSAFKKNQAEE
jgi:hypothetical protein